MVKRGEIGLVNLDPSVGRPSSRLRPGAPARSIPRSKLASHQTTVPQSLSPSVPQSLSPSVPVFLFSLPLRLRRQPLSRAKSAPPLHRRRDGLLALRKPKQHLGAGQVSFERLPLQQIGQLLRNSAHSPVRCLSQLLRSVLACRASPARPLNCLVFACPACFPARNFCSQLLLSYGHLSAIPGQRSTDLRARRKATCGNSAPELPRKRLVRILSYDF